LSHVQIPAFVARATLAVILCPPVPHLQLGTRCDFGAWLGRGWCAVESLAILLQTRSKTPAIVCKGVGQEPSVLDTWMMTPPGLCEWTCCRKGHRRQGPDGTEWTVRHAAPLTAVPDAAVVVGGGGGAWWWRRWRRWRRWSW
jgi:hypothetical protein